MRVSYIELLGQQYPMCFSLTASQELSDKFGGLGAMGEALSSKDIGELAGAVNAILEILLKAGRIYATAAGLDIPPELKCKPGDLIDVTDGSAVQSIFQTIKSDTEREVETKNVEATPGK